MKTVRALTLATMVAAASACAGTRPAADSALEAQIIELDRRGWESWKNNDPTWFVDNTTEGFRSISSSGISTKADVVRDTPSDCTVAAYALADFDFTRLDTNTVLLTYAATQDAVCGGKKAPSSLRVAVVYVKRGDRWLEAMYMQAP